MGSTEVAEKTEAELRKEIDELHRQRREITERLRDPRGIRRVGLLGAGLRNFSANGGRQRGFVRPTERNDSEDQPPAKRRLSSAVVKVEEITGEGSEAVKDMRKKDIAVEGSGSGENASSSLGEKKSSDWSYGVGSQGPFKADFEVPPAEHVPRVLPKNEDPSLVSQSKRMLGQVLGTLERFRKDNVQLSSTEAYMRAAYKIHAEQRAREESERLRQQECEQIAEKRKRDLTLRACIAAKAEEKKLELLFLWWSEHHRKLGNFIRTKADPPIDYLFAKPMNDNATLLEEQKEQNQIAEWYVGNVDKELGRWQNGRKGLKANNDMANLQETMSKELETHQLEHGPKTRKIPGGSNNDDEDDVEDINVGEDDMMDDVLDVDENGRRVDETVKAEIVNGIPLEDDKKDA
ncbi:Pinin [Olea europaea subsp. europaea]|uniref:Pinin n=1 Tax=Olea europaea subsp. europaea TaxID=158383 RepID=A0A8S0RTB5_OLEEU|nr:Pinin [Olea europaea subsp. europaea]